MVLGTCRIHLFIPAAGSLKAKRSVVKSLKERIRNRYNVSVAEVDHHDLWQRTVIAAAVVATDRAQADRTLAAVIRFAESEVRAEVTDVETEIL